MTPDVRVAAESEALRCGGCSTRVARVRLPFDEVCGWAEASAAAAAREAAAWEAATAWEAAAAREAATAETTAPAAERSI